MGESIVITSGKGGTGKTTAVSTIGSCLAALGQRTLCVDMDMTLQNLDLVLGISDTSTRDIGDVITGRCSLAQAVTSHPQIPNLDLLTSPGDVGAAPVTDAGLSAVLTLARAQYDYCLIDSPAGLDAGFYLASVHANRAIVVTGSDSASLRDVQRTVMELDTLGIEDICLIINRFQPRVLHRSLSDIDDIMDFVGVPLLGIVPEDRNVIIAAGLPRPLVLFSRGRAAKAFLRISKRVRGEHVPLRYK